MLLKMRAAVAAAPWCARAHTNPPVRDDERFFLRQVTGKTLSGSEALLRVSFAPPRIAPTCAEICGVLNS